MLQDYYRRFIEQGSNDSHLPEGWLQRCDDEYWLLQACLGLLGVGLHRNPADGREGSSGAM